MRHRYKALITLNVLLLTALAAVTLSPNATAQNDNNRRPGTYTITTGDLRGATADAIFIVDSTNQEVVAMRYNDNAKELEPIDYTSFADTRSGGER